MNRAYPLTHLAVLAGFCSFTGGCGTTAAEQPKSCDLRCQDETATRALRETLKLVYNLTLQGKPVGDQDEVTPCPMGGSARVSGSASAEATQGATQVELLYELSACAYLQRDDEPEESYDAVISGAVVQQGILAVQPTATTALLLSAESVSIQGNVFDPPIAYDEPSCAVRLGQDGNRLSGIWCGREVGFDL